MKTTKLYSMIIKKHKSILDAVYNYSCELLDHTPRFQYFTLHGSKHIDNVVSNIDIMMNAGIELTEDQAFFLTCSACIHDLGMVIPLKDYLSNDIFQGRPQPAEPTNVEKLIRDYHHELIYSYIENKFDFLMKLGLSPSDCSILRDIAKSHRRVNLSETFGFVRCLGALLRLADELDISPSRAPASVLIDHYEEMDSTSCWHWLKHNISEDWRLGHNVIVQSNPTKTVKFLLAVHPPRKSSIPYWLTQLRRPIARVLFDEGVSREIARQWNVSIEIESSQDMSSCVGQELIPIEQKALSANRKLILVIDDESRKMEDLFLVLMGKYHIIYSSNAKDALEKLAAAPVDLAIVDLQIGSGFIWSASETHDFKLTGAVLCKTILEKYPKTKIGILTGSRHDLAEAESLDGLAFLLRKPINPEDFEKEVINVLS